MRCETIFEKFFRPLKLLASSSEKLLVLHGKNNEEEWAALKSLPILRSKLNNSGFEKI